MYHQEIIFVFISDIHTGLGPIYGPDNITKETYGNIIRKYRNFNDGHNQVPEGTIFKYL